MFQILLFPQILLFYPGETDHDFDETIDLIEQVKFASSYSSNILQDQELNHH